MTSCKMQSEYANADTTELCMCIQMHRLFFFKNLYAYTHARTLVIVSSQQID